MDAATCAANSPADDGRGASLELATHGRMLLKQMLSNLDEKHGFGSMTCCAYDTAWVSLLTKVIDGRTQWLFPTTFDCLLSTQSDSGGWTTGGTASIDRILNTAAALLSLSRHATAPHQLQQEEHDLRDRMRRASSFLADELNRWDISATDRVGFEYIVPAMLDLLEKEQPSISFSFQARQRLMLVHEAKMSRFQPEWLYGNERLTAIHSLEAFVGKVDYDRVAHHTVHGSMLASPASTAAYLMNASKWDQDAEDYLRHVVNQGKGGVPSAFPSTYFETSWVLSTLFKAGFTVTDLACDELSTWANILVQGFALEGGTVGFAPFLEPDVDDTAKTIVSLVALGRPTDPSGMIAKFQGDGHFRTYARERNPSFSANCNALLALLCQEHVDEYFQSIIMAVRFLCASWWETDGQIKDKWNASSLYPTILFVSAMTSVLAMIDRGGPFQQQCDPDLQYRVAICLYQACLRALLDQRTDGSWNRSVEETSYSLLILAEARRLVFFEDLQQQLQDAIDRATQFLETHDSEDDEYLWIEKVSYRSPTLAKCYELAALKAASLPVDSRVGQHIWAQVRPQHLVKQRVDLFARAAIFRNTPKWELVASMVESSLYLLLLRDRRNATFPRRDIETDEKYFEIVPFFWTSTNNRARTYASNQLIFDMTTIALLNFQMDEFMESVVTPASLGRTDDIRWVIQHLLSDDETTRNEFTSMAQGTKDSLLLESTWTAKRIRRADRDEVYLPIARFLQTVLNLPSILLSSGTDQKALRWELRKYLLAHIQQAEDSTRVSQGQTTATPSTLITPFFSWVTSVAADSISCPYSFHLISCMLGAALTPALGNRDAFPSAAEKYLAKDVCLHLSTMCRLYNDLGSMERDLQEGNLNSIEFPEFQAHDSLASKTSELLKIAEHERSCMLSSLDALETRCIANAGQGHETLKFAKRRMCIWRMFCEQVDLYGQVYVLQDMSAKISRQNGM